MIFLVLSVYGLLRDKVLPRADDSAGPKRGRSAAVRTACEGNWIAAARSGTCRPRWWFAPFWSKDGTIAQDNDNPKMNPWPSTKKDPDDWVSGDDPMTGAQASCLKTLGEQAEDEDACEDGLSKAEASKRIDILKAKVGLE